MRINFFGLVIGWSGETAYAWGDSSSSPFGVIGRPFIWSQRTGMRDLNTLIPQNGAGCFSQQLTSTFGARSWDKALSTDYHAGFC